MRGEGGLIWGILNWGKNDLVRAILENKFLLLNKFGAPPDSLQWAASGPLAGHSTSFVASSVADVTTFSDFG